MGMIATSGERVSIYVSPIDAAFEYFNLQGPGAGLSVTSTEVRLKPGYQLLRLRHTPVTSPRHTCGCWENTHSEVSRSHAVPVG
jgi:hypothetical protein